MREQQAAFFQTKEGETRWGVKFDKGLSGGLGYRSVNFSYRHFPLYMKGLLSDKDMKPRINTPDGIQAIKDFAAGVEYMTPVPPSRVSNGNAFWYQGDPGVRTNSRGFAIIPVTVIKKVP